MSLSIWFYFLCFGLCLSQSMQKDISRTVDGAMDSFYGIKIERTSCKNRSVEFSYSFHKDMAKEVVVYVATLRDVVTGISNISVKNGMLQGTRVVVLQNNKYIKKTLKIVLISQTDNDIITRNHFSPKFNFSLMNCSSDGNRNMTDGEAFVEASPFVSIVVSVSLIAVIVIICALFCLHKKYNLKQVCMKAKPVIWNVQIDDKEGQARISDKMASVSALLSDTDKKSTQVYVIYLNDHQKHKEIVIKFVNFLRADLGFHVRFELFESEAIAQDPSTWMDESLKMADKVIVIWSPGATERWNQYNCKEYGNLDLFTPILRIIRKDIRFDRNIEKYFFGYFEYCTKDVIPNDFIDSSIRHFKLMQHFKEMYCSLKGIPLYIPGAVVQQEKVDNYFDPDINAFGPSLKQAIHEMCMYVKENPNWHLEFQNICETEKCKPITFSSVEMEHEILENHLNILPPVILSEKALSKGCNMHSDENKARSKYNSHMNHSSQFHSQSEACHSSTQLENNFHASTEKLQAKEISDSTCGVQLYLESEPVPPKPSVSSVDSGFISSFLPSTSLEH